MPRKLYTPPELSFGFNVFGIITVILMILFFYFIFIFIPTYVYRRTTKFEKNITVKYTSKKLIVRSRYRYYTTIIDTDGNSYKTRLPFDSIHVGKKYKLKGHGSDTITSIESLNYTDRKEK
jgi:hypothetical protein